MTDLPDAWSLPEPEWIPMAPGIRWLVKTPDGALRMMVTSEVAATLARVYDGRAGMESLGLADDPAFDGALALERIQGAAGVLTACLYARHCLMGWEGMEHPRTGEALSHEDPENVRAALIHGPPPSGMPLLGPFLAWLERPHAPVAAEAVRLRTLAKDHWTGGAERCRACVDEGDACAKGGAVEGEICPRLKSTPRTPIGAMAWKLATTGSGFWSRAGMSGAVSGLDYGSALLAYEKMAPAEQEPDFGAAYSAFRAIEAGRLEAEVQRAEEIKAAADA